MEDSFLEMQEIVFWQQLNRQLISWRSKKESIIKDGHQDFIQKFSFDHKLFSKITTAYLFDDIPLVLITDFSEICFLNFKEGSWNDCLGKLIQNSFILDIEQALADALVAMEKYGRKFDFGIDRDGVDREEDDEELYLFIEDYLQKLEERGWDLREILNKLYAEKAKFIQRVIRAFDYRELLAIKDDLLIFDLNKIKEKGQKKDVLKFVNDQYINFLYKADSIVHWPTFSFFRAEIENLLEEKKGNLKPSIRKFAEHEYAIFKEEARLLYDFADRLKAKEKTFLTIPICNSSPFYFLRNPFPLL